MPQPFRIGVNVFVQRDGKTLLGKRKSGYGAGEWGLPGGHVEFIEKFFDTAARELKEETGLTAKLFEFNNLVNQPRPDEDGHYVQVGVVAINPVGEPINVEPENCQGWEWFSLDALPEPLFR